MDSETLALPTYDFISFGIRNTDLVDSCYPLLALVFTSTFEIVPTIHSILRGFGTSIVALLAMEYIISPAPSTILDESIFFDGL